MAPEINSLSSESNVFHHLYEQARLLYNFASLMTTHSNHKNCSELAPTLTMTLKIKHIHMKNQHNILQLIIPKPQHHKIMKYLKTTC